MEAEPSTPEIVPTEPTSQINIKSEPEQDRQSPEHRISCHRCGNIRKRRLICSRKTCPHIFCGRCCDKMKDEYGPDIFVDGCPVCKDMCCCSNKSISCLRVNHCYRKCPASKNKAACTAYKEELAHCTLPDNRPPSFIPNEKTNGILDLLAAVADNQLNEQIAAANGKRKYQESAASSSPSSAQKSNQPKTDDITSNPAFGFVDPSKIAFLPLMSTGDNSSSSSSAASQFLTSDMFSPYGAYATMMQPNSAGPALALFPAPASSGSFEGLNQRFLSSDYLIPAAAVPVNGSGSTATGAPSSSAAPAVPPLSLFSGPYRTSAPLYVDTSGGYHLYDMNGIDGFVQARSAAAAAVMGHHPGFAPIGLAAIPGLQYHPSMHQTPLSYAFLTRPMMPASAVHPTDATAPSSTSGAAATTRRIPFAGTDFPAVLTPKSFDVTQRPSPPKTSQGGASSTSIVLDNRGESDLLGAATVGAAAASLASSSSSVSTSQLSSDPINILALVSSYSSTMGGGSNKANNE